LAIVTKRFESALEDGVTGVDALFALALFKAALLFTAQADNVTIPDIVLNSGIVEAGFQDTLTNLVAGTFGAT
jgi:tagatose-1,6-bisphosphate aldolase